MNQYECLCGEAIDKDFPKVFVLDGPEGVQDLLLQGELFRLDCPACGRVLRVEERAVVTTVDKAWSVVFLPEEWRDQVLAGTFELESPADRLVVGYKELAEKVLLRLDGFDDRVVEYLKFGFLLKVGRDAILIYSGHEAGKLEFWVEGLEEGKVGKTSISEDAYLQQAQGLADILKRPSFSAVLSSPRVCIRDYREPKPV